jgi:hypothetical protein
MIMMEPRQIELQLQAIREVTDKALASKDYAIQFLKDAGLWDDEQNEIEFKKAMINVKSPTK